MELEGVVIDKVALTFRSKSPHEGEISYQRNVSGAGGSRTLVQTRKPYAFYMLIPAFIFVMRQDPDHQSHPYLLKFHLTVGAPDRLFPIYLHRWVLRFGTTSLERCLVLSPCKRIKPVIYCTSIRQRERSCFRQLIVRPTWFRSPQPSLRMLTYHLILLSNPVNPNMILYLANAKIHIFL